MNKIIFSNGFLVLSYFAFNLYKSSGKDARTTSPNYFRIINFSWVTAYYPS